MKAFNSVWLCNNLFSLSLQTHFTESFLSDLSLITQKVGNHLASPLQAVCLEATGPNSAQHVTPSWCGDSSHWHLCASPGNVQFVLLPSSKFLSVITPPISLAFSSPTLPPKPEPKLILWSCSLSLSQAGGKDIWQAPHFTVARQLLCWASSAFQDMRA